MSKDREFIDSTGIIGRDRLNRSKEKELSIKLSRSYNSKFDQSHKVIQFRFTKNYIVIDFSKVVGNRVQVSKKNLKELANWIITTMERKDATGES